MVIKCVPWLYLSLMCTLVIQGSPKHPLVSSFGCWLVHDIFFSYWFSMICSFIRFRFLTSLFFYTSLTSSTSPRFVYLCVLHTLHFSSLNITLFLDSWPRASKSWLSNPYHSVKNSKCKTLWWLWLDLKDDPMTPTKELGCYQAKTFLITPNLRDGYHSTIWTFPPHYI